MLKCMTPRSGALTLAHSPGVLRRAELSNAFGVRGSKARDGPGTARRVLTQPLKDRAILGLPLRGSRDIQLSTRLNISSEKDWSNVSIVETSSITARDLGM